jgi:hypothetical protein
MPDDMGNARNVRDMDSGRPLSALKASSYGEGGWHAACDRRNGGAAQAQHVSPAVPGSVTGTVLAEQPIWMTETV